MKKERLYTTSDGTFTLHTIGWLPDDQSPRAVLQIVHGISEYMDRYDDFATYLMLHGIIVIGCDLPGHGKTATCSDDYGYFADKDGWTLVVRALNDLASSLKQSCPHLPFFLMGHSMGSFLVRTMMIDYPDLANGVILSGTGQPQDRLLRSGLAITNFSVRLLGPRARNKGIEQLAMGAYNRQFAPSRTTADWISRDTVVVDRYTADPLSNFLPTVSLFRDLLEGLIYIGDSNNHNTLNQETPVFIFSGDQDPVGENGVGVRRVVHALHQAGCHNIQLKLYPNGRHEMLNELNRQEVYVDILTWLNKQIEDYYEV